MSMDKAFHKTGQAGQDCHGCGGNLCMAVEKLDNGWSKTHNYSSLQWGFHLKRLHVQYLWF